MCKVVAASTRLRKVSFGNGCKEREDSVRQSGGSPDFKTTHHTGNTEASGLSVFTNRKSTYNNCVLSLSSVFFRSGGQTFPTSPSVVCWEEQGQCREEGQQLSEMLRGGREGHAALQTGHGGRSEAQPQPSAEPERRLLCGPETVPQELIPRRHGPLCPRTTLKQCQSEGPPAGTFPGPLPDALNQPGKQNRRAVSLATAALIEREKYFPSQVPRIRFLFL